MPTETSTTGVTLSTGEPPTTGVSSDEEDLALGLGVGLPLCVLVIGLFAASIFIILKRRKQTHSSNVLVEQGKELHTASKRRKQQDHYVHAIQHHDQATGFENPDTPVYSNVSEAVYVNVTQSQALNTKQEQRSSQTPKCSDSTLKPRPEQQGAGSAEPVYENLRRTP
ncbi:hypothetical protein chiPu_0020494 [Chiloscyllium punctatum]|uniref:Uncharacterized protein n=1 Tax=Chiloscyllium punctatum TaxID=137246 RepID=A0A401RGE7_CHIPU|nr:hypothetical protein [Chiloscyllium punctatum]